MRDAMRYRENRAEQRLSIRLTKNQKEELTSRYNQYVNEMSEHCPLIEPVGFSEWIRQTLNTENNGL